MHIKLLEDGFSEVREFVKFPDFLQEKGCKRNSIRNALRGLLFLGTSLLFTAISLGGASEIPKRAGNWRVETGPPGNAFYELPESVNGNFNPPSAEVLKWPKMITPGALIEEVKMEEGNYRIKAEFGEGKDKNEYKYKISAKGRLLELEFENDGKGIDVEADELVFRGTKKSVPAAKVPEAVMETLRKVLPEGIPFKAWTADTGVGERYVIQWGELVFYARPDGRIEAAGRVDDGALNEIDPPKNSRPPGSPSPEQVFEEELRTLLGPFRERFNFKRQIEKLRGRDEGEEGGYRYIVMGDSRSQLDLWTSMMKHIESLDPKPKFIISTGDVVPKGSAREYASYYISPLLETDIPLFIAVGNHDTGSDDSAREFRFLFGEDSLNYFFDYRGARYVFLDDASKFQSLDKTWKWLEKTLESAPEGYRKYVSAHKPPATIKKWAYHALDAKDSRIFTDLLARYEVDHVYLGHIHAYSTALHDGVSYTVSGGGGAGLHDRFGALGNVHHYIICDVSADGAVRRRVVRFYKDEED